MTSALREQREATLWRMLLRAQNVHAAEVTRRIRERGHPQLQAGWPRVLGYLDTEGTRPGVIATRAGMTRQAVGQMFDDIERAGCVTRVPDPDDKRGTIVRFTPKGRRMLKTAVEAMAEVEAEYRAAVGAEDYSTMKKGMARLLDVIDPQGTLR